MCEVSVKFHRSDSLEGGGWVSGVQLVSFLGIDCCHSYI